MSGKTLTRLDLSEAVFREVGLSRNESADHFDGAVAHVKRDDDPECPPIPVGQMGLGFVRVVRRLRRQQIEVVAGVRDSKLHSGKTLIARQHVEAQDLRGGRNPRA